MEIVSQLEITDVISRRKRSDDRKYVCSSQASCLRIAWRILRMHDRKLNGCRQRLLFARHLIPRKCSLCSQGMLFDDKLQTQLNHIRASNKISTKADNSTFSTKRKYAKPQTSSKQWRPFLGKTPPGNQSQTYRKPPQYNSWKKRSTDQTNKFEGILPSLLAYFRCKAQMLTAGSIAAYSPIWQAVKTVDATKVFRHSVRIYWFGNCSAPPKRGDPGNLFPQYLLGLRRMVLFGWFWTWSLLIPMSLIIWKWTTFGLPSGW